MAIRTFIYPSVQATNPSVGLTGSAVPLSATLIGAKDNSGNLVPITSHTIGPDQAFDVDVRHSVLPDGAATEATLATVADNQTNGNQLTELVDDNGNTAGPFVAGPGTVYHVPTKDLATVASNFSSIYMNVVGGLNDSNQSKFIHVDANGHVKINLFDGAGNTVNLGQSTLSGSLPVAIASDQTAIPASQSGTWNINNITGTVSLPTGASTSALQTAGNASLSSIDGKLNSLGQKAMAASMPVVIASDQSTVPVSMASAPLPTGAATAANQTTLGAQTTKINDGTNTAAVTASSALKVDGSAVTQPVSGTVTVTQATGTNLHAVIDSGTVSATQSGTWNITNISGTVSLPTGASTSALQTTGNTSLSNIDTNTSALALSQGTSITSKLGPMIQAEATTNPPTYTTATINPLTTTTAGGLRVDLATVNNGQAPAVNYGQVTSGSLRINQGGRAKANAPVRNDYTSTNVTTAAYVQLVASTSNDASQIEIFDSSGQTLVLAVGAAASEVDQINIFPGGNGRVPLFIPSGSRVSIKAVSATASVGEIDINFYQ
jgi:hypothetical protein